MEIEEINEKLKRYLELKQDIELLEQARETIKKELEHLLKESGVDKMTTQVGTISYVNKKYETLNKDKLKEFLNAEQLQSITTFKETKYIMVTPIKEKKGEESI